MVQMLWLTFSIPRQRKGFRLRACVSHFSSWRRIKHRTSGLRKKGVDLARSFAGIIGHSGEGRAAGVGSVWPHDVHRRVAER